MMSLSRLAAVTRKEVRQMRRDRLTFAMIFGIPIMQLLLFGYAINTDVRNLSTAIADEANSHLSREFVSRLNATQVTNIEYRVDSADELEAMLESGEISIGVAIPHDFDRRVVDAFKVVCAGSGSEARSLSGGNLQKFILGREILLEPSLLVLAYPTWGVDVGAAAQIRQAVIDLRDRGAGILVVSEELEELFEISDRIAVIGKGRLSPAKRTRDTGVEEVGRWMAGMFAPAGDEGPQDAA